jgi:hypothetical protein
MNNIFSCQNKFLIFLKYRSKSFWILWTCCKIHATFFFKHTKILQIFFLKCSNNFKDFLSTCIFFYLFRPCLGKVYFYLKQNCQNRLTGLFAKYAFKAKFFLSKQLQTKQGLNIWPDFDSIRLTRNLWFDHKLN